MASEQTHTGPEPERVRTMFGAIAPRYDLANSVLSMGIHHLWRRRVVRWSGAGPGDAVLDCATGTGDLALAFKQCVGPEGTVLGTDFCTEMLDGARVKAGGGQEGLRFETADVTALPYDSDRFSVSSISFGIRNVNEPGRGISELARVTRPGGVVMVLEFGQVRVPIIRTLYDLYSRLVLPRIGGLLTGKPDAYDYLQTSAAHFPSGEDFAALMRASGDFKEVRFRPLSLGIAYVYRGVVAG